MERLTLPQWVLNARLDGNAVHFVLGDGRRLAWHAQRPMACLSPLQPPVTVDEVVGPDLAARLCASAPRPLSVIHGVEESFDLLDWESLSLGQSSLGAHFALARQIASEADARPLQPPTPGDSLLACVVHDRHPRLGLQAPRIVLEALDQELPRSVVSDAEVLIADGPPLAAFWRQLPPSQRRRLIIAAGRLPCRDLAALLDTGAALLSVAQPGDLADESVVALIRQLEAGFSLGEMVRWLRSDQAPGLPKARLYGDPELRLRLPASPASRRHVTTLSFDIVGSTRLIGVLGDEAYADLLAEVHRRGAECIRRHGGTPEDPQGDDGVMGYFGHPVAIEGAAVRAVEAGLDLLRQVRELDAAIRIGIATGLVAIKDGQPVGLSIHLAARLQQAASPGALLISSSTQHLVAHAFDLDPMPERLPMKGLDSPEAVYVVRSARHDGHPHRLNRQRPNSPLLGRQAELERLHTAWHLTRRAKRQLVVLTGEAGMGKSRLVHEFRRQLTQAGVKVLECRCRADASSTPFLSLTEALRRWLDIRHDEAADEAIGKLRKTLPPHAQGPDALGLLSALLGLTPPAAPANPGVQRQRLLGLLVDWFAAFVGDQPGCLVIEDWHWADPSMQAFVEHLMGERSGPALMVLVTQRGEAGLATLPAADEHLALQRLAPEAARALLRHVCADSPLSPGLVDQLALRGDGVPLFLEEAARMALELGADSPGGDLQALVAVPPSLQDLLTARLDGLGEAKAVAQVAAVLGRQFQRSILSALLIATGRGFDAAALDVRLDALVASGLVAPGGDGEFAFRHALIRDAAYASLWARDRRRMHEHVVALLRQQDPARSALQPELLAFHLTEAGLHAEAVAQWELAARHATARSAEQESIIHLRRALAALPHMAASAARDRQGLRLQLMLAARLIATEGYGSEAVRTAYLEAERLCDGIGDDGARFKVEMGLEACRFMRAEFEHALAHGRRAAAIAERSGDIKQRLHAHWGLACTLFHQGRLRATMREMDAALAAYTPALHPQFGVQDPGIMCMAYSSWALWELGRPDSALQRIQSAVEMAQAFEHRFSQAVAMSYAVSVELLRGDHDAALARAESCAALCDEGGFPVWLAITRCMRGYLWCQRGQLDDGLREMEVGYALWRKTGAVVSQPLYLALQVEGLLLAGRLDDAADRVEQGLALVAKHGERQLASELTRLQAELALRRGLLHEGEAGLKRAYALALRTHRLGFALRSATTLASLWAGSGRLGRARRLLEPLAARWQEGRDTRDLRAAAALIASWRDVSTARAGP